MKAVWLTVPLGSLCAIKNGKSDTQDAVESGEFAFFDRSRTVKRSTRFLFDCEALIIPGEGIEFLPRHFSGKFDLHQRAYALHDFVGNIDVRFLYYYLHHRSDYLPSVAVGATVKSLRMRHFEGFPVAITSLPEQHRIVAILDAAFDGIATAKTNAEQNLQNARALFESHLQQVFTERGEGWITRRVSEVAKHSLGKMLDKAKNKGELQPYLRNLNVRWFGFDLSDLLEMPFLPTEAEKYTAVKGDVLICEGGYPGRAAIWDEDYPIYFQKALHRVRFHEPEHNKWFVYFLYAQDKTGELKKHFNGAGIQHFTGEGLARFEIPLPPLPELRRVVEKFAALAAETQRLESLYRQKLAALDELKKSLLHQAFSGAL